MSEIYTPNTNKIANILNRRTETIFAETIKELDDFKHLIKSQKEYGDTLEFIANALAYSENYDPKINQSEKYVDTVLNRYYQSVNIDKVYYASTSKNEYAKALKDPKALAELSAKVVANMSKSWAVDLYNEFNNALSWQSYFGIGGSQPVGKDISLTLSPTSDFTEITDEDIDNVIETILNTLKDMRFYGQDYITVGTDGLTQAQQDRILANAKYEDLTLYIHYKWYSKIQNRLSKRLRDLFDIDNKIKIIEIKTNGSIDGVNENTFICYILHNNALNYHPRLIENQESRPFGASRTDHALIVEGTLTANPLYPTSQINWKPTT